MITSLIEIDKMTSDEYASRLRDPEFSAEVTRLLAEATARRNGEQIVIEETPAGLEQVRPTPTPAPVAAVEPVEQRYEYQPTDETGRPMGGRQVIKYKSQDELRDKLVEQNTLILRQLRKVSRETLLGAQEPAPDNAERFQNVPEFKSRELTQQERFDIARDLIDPAKTAQATETLIESVFGQKPTVVASTLNEVQRSLVQSKAVENYIEFVNTSADYNDCAENREIVTRWMGKRNLAPTVANFKIAQNTLSGAGLLLESPAVQQVSPVPPAAPAAVVPVEPIVPNPQALAATTPGLGSEPQPQVKRQSRVPSGLNESISSAASTDNVVAGGHSLTLRDIDRMTSDEYRQKLRDPEFKKLVNQLEADAAAKRAARQGVNV